MSLPKLQNRITTFEEQVSLLQQRLDRNRPLTTRASTQVCTLREEYADMLQDDEDWSDAAKVLMAIPLESGGR